MGMEEDTFVYDVDGCRYPNYLKTGNAMQFILPVAKQFCKGDGLDVGAGKWPFPDAVPIDISYRLGSAGSAYDLPANRGGRWDFIFSSHCLEHLENPVRALEHWKTMLRPNGCLFLYLPHSDMTYWRPEHCRKHLHAFTPGRIANMLTSLGYVLALQSERDLAWSFATVAYNDVPSSILTAER